MIEFFQISGIWKVETESVNKRVMYSIALALRFFMKILRLAVIKTLLLLQLLIALVTSVLEYVVTVYNDFPQTSLDTNRLSRVVEYLHSL